MALRIRGWRAVAARGPIRWRGGGFVATAAAGAAAAGVAAAAGAGAGCAAAESTPAAVADDDEAPLERAAVKAMAEQCALSPGPHSRPSRHMSMFVCAPRAVCVLAVNRAPSLGRARQGASPGRARALAGCSATSSNGWRRSHWHAPRSPQPLPARLPACAPRSMATALRPAPRRSLVGRTRALSSGPSAGCATEGPTAAARAGRRRAPPCTTAPA